MKPALSLLGWLTGLGFTAYFIHFLRSSFDPVALSALLSWNTFLALGTASLVYVLIIPLAGWAWSRLLKDMGLTWTWQKSAAVIGLTQLAKYIPGNVAQHLSRGGLAISKKMPPDLFVGSVLIETLLVIGAALLVGSLGWLATSLPQDDAVLAQTLGLSALILMLAIPATALFFLALQHLRAKFTWAKTWFSEQLHFPSPFILSQAVIAYALNFLILGFTLWLICRVLAPSFKADFLFLTTAFAFAWLGGFLAPGLPAGLGAREGVLSLFLTGLLPEAELLNILLAMRMATVLGDLLSFLLALYLTKYMVEKTDSPSDKHT